MLSPASPVSKIFLNISTPVITVFFVSLIPTISSSSPVLTTPCSTRPVATVPLPDIERGQVLAKPASVTPHTKFEAQAYVLKKEEGGRHTPFFTKYRPQFYFRTTDVTGEVTLPSGTEMIMPGDDAKFNVKLITPIAMNEKLNFAIREGGKTVGAGVVTKIIK